MLKYHPNIRIVEGRIPVLISAPHVVPIRLREEGGNDFYIKPREKKIKGLLHVLCKKGGGWGIFTESDGVLERWDQEILLEYKKQVRDLIQRKNIALFLDLHGAQESRPFMLDYDFKLQTRYPLDLVVEKMLIENFSQHFDAKQLSYGFFRSINGPGRKTLTYYVRKHCRIPAIQLEYNHTARINNEHFQKLIDITSSLLRIHENSSLRVSPEKIELRD